MRSAIALTLFLFCLSAYGQIESLSTVPFSVEKNCIYLYCKVNGKDSLKFLFDTGANVSVINTSSSRNPALKIDGESVNTGSNGTNITNVSSGNSVLINAISFSDVSFTLIPFGDDYFDGVIGTNLMKDHIIEIDYNKREMHFYRRENFSKNLSRYDKQKLYSVNDYPAIKCAVTVNGKKYSGLFGLDSGADDALTLASPFVRSKKLQGKMTLIGRAVSEGSDGSQYTSDIVSVPELQFGKKVFYDIPASLSVSTEGIDATEDMAGFFGNNFMKRFNTVLDFKGGLIYFLPNRNLHTPF